MNLLMLTKFFPFGTGEAFIENEIDVVAKHYKKVLVISCEVPKNCIHTRDLPQNVSVIRINSSSKIKDLLTGITLLNCKKPPLRDEYSTCKNLFQRMFLAYFEAKSRRTFLRIEKNTDFLNFVKTPFILYSYWFFMTARVGTLIARNKTPIYMITRAHRYDLYANENKLGYLPFRKYLLSNYNCIFPCSENGSSYLGKMYPQYKSKIHTAFLGTPDHGIGKPSPKGTFRIVSCSRIAKVKRVELLAEAIRLLRIDDMKIEWIHIGGGEGFTSLKSLVDRMKCNARVTLLGDMKNQDVINLYAKKPIDLFINVSSSEGLPVSIMEAISFGIPVVATDVGGTSEIVFPRITGRLLPKNPKKQQICDYITEFIIMKQNNLPKYMEYRTNCRSLWESQFIAKINYQNLCQMIEKGVNDVINNNPSI